MSILISVNGLKEFKDADLMVYLQTVLSEALVAFSTKDKLSDTLSYITWDFGFRCLAIRSPVEGIANSIRYNLFAHSKVVIAIRISVTRQTFTILVCFGKRLNEFLQSDPPDGFDFPSQRRFRELFHFLWVGKLSSRC